MTTDPHPAAQQVADHVDGKRSSTVRSSIFTPPLIAITVLSVFYRGPYFESRLIEVD